MTWRERWSRRLLAQQEPDPFDCAWCHRDGGYRRHDMCTGKAVRPHAEGTLRPAVLTACACALRRHEPAAGQGSLEPTRFPALPDGWTRFAGLRRRPR